MSKIVFITGASSGIGQALAARFYAAGYALALVARRTAEVHKWIEEQKLDPKRCRVYSADVADTASIVAACQACMAGMGVPDVVIACAGISVGMDTSELDDIAVMAQTFAINNTGLAATFHPFIKPMQTRSSGCQRALLAMTVHRGRTCNG